MGEPRREAGAAAQDGSAGPYARRPGEPLGRAPAERARFATAIEPMLDASRADGPCGRGACLGRLGQPSSVNPLVARLADPSKIVWRAAAWALRRLGNRGIGHEAIVAALGSSDPAIRRGAARIFAYQFHGMDDRPELARPFFALTRDPDLLTRLQALRTLRQWFYRTADPAMSRTDRRDLPGPDGGARRTGRPQEPERGALHHARREPGRRREPPEEHRRAAREDAAGHPRGPEARSSATCC